jgi:hypothetical protein
METVQLDIFQSGKAKDAGMQRAVDHADLVNPCWSDQAYDLLLKFLSIHVGAFQAEEVRSYAAMIDFPLPPSNRAWGAIIVRAVKAGIIKRVGYAPVRNIKAHKTPASLWQQVKKAI